MTTPTREQVVQWAINTGFDIEPADQYHDRDEVLDRGNIWITDWLEYFTTLTRADLEAELESLRKDAERYQFIACQADEVTGHVFAWQTDCCDRGVRDVSLDALIDSAIEMVMDRSLEKRADAAIAAAPKEK